MLCALHAFAPAGPESCLRYDSNLQSASLSAHRAYQPGVKLSDSYGRNRSPSFLHSIRYLCRRHIMDCAHGNTCARETSILYAFRFVCHTRRRSLLPCILYAFAYLTRKDQPFPPTGSSYVVQEKNVLASTGQPMYYRRGSVDSCGCNLCFAGEEVFDSYGCNLSPSDLLLDYGFVDPHNTNHRTMINPHDIGVLPMMITPTKVDDDQ
eukprot:scaffold75684_cov20-Tisochrysis_lutea.AAC.1